MEQGYRSSIVVAVAFFIFSSISSVNGDGVCKTDDCKTTAERILKYMDPEIKPCDDFYKFTCAKLLKSELPIGKTSKSSTTDVQDVVNAQIRELLEEAVQPEELDAYKTAKKYYALCVDIVNSERQKSSRNETEASNRLRSAGWPVLEGWSEDQWTLHEHETRLKDIALGGGSLFHIELGSDPQTPENVQMTVDQPILSRWLIDRQLLDEPEVTINLPHVRAYLDYMVDLARLAVMFGTDRQTAEHQLRASLLLELDLEKIVDMPKERYRQYELMTVAELQERAGWVDWPALLAATVVPKSLSISDDDLVKVYQPDYLSRLGKLIEKHPKRAIANFMGWKAAERMSLMLTPDMIARKRQFDQDMGIDLREPWEQCVELTSRSGVGLAVSSMYVKKYNSEGKQAVALDMVSKVQQQMDTLIKNQDWMEDNTKTKALLKLCKMKDYIGHSRELLSTKNINDFFQGLTIDQFNDFIEAQIHINNWMNEYGKERFRNKWAKYGKMATTVNAFYDPQANMLQLTAAILHPPFFSPSLPKYMLYPAIGAIAGHEITHGFDNNGVLFDADGAYKKNWWDDSSKMNFKQKGECMLKQYRDYIRKCNSTEAGGPIPYLAGNESLGEIIADSGGLKLAFLAYKKLSDQLEEPEPLLPNLENYSRDQLFFIGLGNLWCTLNDPKNVRALALYPWDMHPPPEFRINGVLQNFPQFSETFDCKAGTNMNPKSKCSVW